MSKIDDSGHKNGAKKKLERIVDRIVSSPHPAELKSTSIWSRLFFSYLDPLFTLSETDPALITPETTFPITNEDCAAKVVSKFSKILIDENSPKIDKKEENELDEVTMERRMSQITRKIIQNPKISLAVAWIKTYKYELIFSFLYTLTSILGKLMVLHYTEKLLTDFQAFQSDQSPENSVKGFRRQISLSLIIIIFHEVLSPIGCSWIWYYRCRYTQRLKTLFNSLVFHKMTSKRVQGKNQSLAVNFIQCDIPELDYAIWCADEAFGIVFEVLSGSVVGFLYFGSSFAITICSLILIVWASSYIMKTFESGYLDLEQRKYRDKRLNLLKQILANFDFVKQNSLENGYYLKLFGLRKQEFGFLAESNLKDIYGAVLANLTSFGSIYCFLVVYVWRGGDLDVARMTVLLRIVGWLGRGSELAELVGCVVAYNNVLQRVAGFLASTEVSSIQKLNSEGKKEINEESDTVLRRFVSAGEVDESNSDVFVENGSFCWVGGSEQSEGSIEGRLGHSGVQGDGKQQIGGLDGEGGEADHKKFFVLKNLNFRVKRGDLTAIVGKVGAGKSTLISTLLGETFQVAGDPQKSTKSEKIINFRDGLKIALVSQKPWLFNGTVEENITFGSGDAKIGQKSRFSRNFENGEKVEFRDKKHHYWHRLELAVLYSALIPDLESFSGSEKNWKFGLQKIVGEAGGNLSGGQRARVALARALFHEVDFYIFDDILAALDAKTANFIIKETMCGLLSGKTRLVVSNSPKLIKNSNWVYGLEKGELSLVWPSDGTGESRILAEMLQINENETREHTGDLEDTETENYSILDSSIHQSLPESQKPPKTQKMADSDYRDSSVDHSSFPSPIRNPEIPKEPKLDKIPKTAQLIDLQDFPEKTQVTATQLSLYIITELIGIGLLAPLPIICIFKSILDQKSLKSLESWSEEYNTLQSPLRALAGISLFFITSGLARILITTQISKITYKLSQNLHSKMSFKLLHCRKHVFLARRPIGAVINLFSKDLTLVDNVVFEELPKLARLLFEFISVVLFIMVSFGWPVFVLAATFLVFLFKTQSAHLKVSRRYQGHIKDSSDSLISILLDISPGLAHIRQNTKIRKFFENRFFGLLERLNRLSMMDNCFSQWFDMRVHLYVNGMMGIPCYLFLLLYAEKVDLATVGYLFVALGSLGGTIEDLMYVRGKLDHVLGALRRCFGFLREIEFEKGLELSTTFDEFIDDLEDRAELRAPIKSIYERFVTADDWKFEKFKKIEKIHQMAKFRQRLAIKPPQSYQTDPQYSLEFDHVDANYQITKNKQKAAKMVISNISLKIRQGERIGLVGRTGSGKSTLVKLLWRYIEPVEGAVRVNGRKTTEISPKQLRSQFFIVSQHPALFDGTLRDNLDPLGCLYGDEGMTEVLTSLEFGNPDFERFGLDMEIGEGGAGLSGGEKQIVSFARCLLFLNSKFSKFFENLNFGENGKNGDFEVDGECLRHPPILILDEPTSNIDFRTEEVIQRHIFPKSKNTKNRQKSGENEHYGGLGGVCRVPESSTVVIIAHRLETILNCDRIVVLKNGKIQEIGPPQTLMEQPESYFSKIFKSFEAGRET